MTLGGLDLIWCILITAGSFSSRQVGRMGPPDWGAKEKILTGCALGLRTVCQLYLTHRAVLAGLGFAGGQKYLVTPDITTRLISTRKQRNTSEGFH